VVKKSIVYARDVGIRVVGLIENMSGFLCPECRVESDLFEGSQNVQQLCNALDIPLLGRIPLDRRISQSCDRGTPLLEATEPTPRRFEEIANRIIEDVKVKRQ
jgi:ATP-binding protein involved in chromosome partitioning